MAWQLNGLVEHEARFCPVHSKGITAHVIRRQRTAICAPFTAAPAAFGPLRQAGPNNIFLEVLHGDVVLARSCAADLKAILPRMRLPPACPIAGPPRTPVY